MAPKKGQPQQQQQQRRSIASFFSVSPSASAPPILSPSRTSVCHSTQSQKPLLVVGPANSPSPFLANPVALPGQKRSRTDFQDDLDLGGERKTSPCQESSDASALVGRRIKVYWPLDDAWYEGEVTGLRPPCMHVINYIDGDEEVLDMSKEKYVLLPRLSGRKLRKLSSSKCRSHPSPEPSHSNDIIDSDYEEKGNKNSVDNTNLNEETSESNGTRSLENGGSSPPCDKDVQLPDYTRVHLAKSVGDVSASMHMSKSSSDGILVDIAHNKRNHMQAGCTRAYQGEALHAPLMGDAIERFGHRNGEKFKFLDRERKDANGRQPGDLGFDPCTLYMPEEFLKMLPSGQRQWWEIKSKNMDKVLLFKMGKFYEMFEMDAHIGAQSLSLQYMKGDQPHCGFPEKNFEDNAGRLARLGYRVVVVEQVETPQQLHQRNLKSGTKDKVVKRDICAVITKGTITDAEMLASSPDASYLMSAYELCNDESSSMLGLCFLDAATSRFILGQFLDDMARSCLMALLSELRPVELVIPDGMLSSLTEKVLKEHTRGALVTKLNTGSELWDYKRTINELKTYFEEHHQTKRGSIKKSEAKLDNMPELLQTLVTIGDEAKASICALGGCISYLRQCWLDQRLLSAGRFELLPGSHLPLGECLSPGEAGTQDSVMNVSEPFMILDSSALENLDILENSSDGTVSGTLFSQLDYCITSFGRRLLKQWVVRPLLQKESIIDRQKAIEEIKDVLADAASSFRRDLVKLPDMERLVVRLHACSERRGRNAQAVVLYEDAAKKQLKEFITALCGFQKISQVLCLFGSKVSQVKSRRLKKLLSPEAGFPDLIPLLQFFEAAFDWSEAESSGHISPHKGVDSEFDDATMRVLAVEQKLLEYLEKQQEYFGSQNVNYVTVGKDRYQIEVPDLLQKKIPVEYEAASQKKGFRRYYTLQVKTFLKELAAEEEKKEVSLKNILQGLLRRFCVNHCIWLHAIRVIAELDALISLAMACDLSGVGILCKPKISEAANPFLVAKALRHPILEGGLDGGRVFVPNDISLGYGGQACFILLTGPNMGGKSTLLRQVCLAVILAQIGVHVPADSFELSPVDHIFVRMGAKDHIMNAQSTFLVELSETANMLRCATRHSLITLDELGRGTSTSDGQAVAHAVLEHLAHEVECRGMFSTHYHRIADDHADDNKVGLYHMACRVDVKEGFDNVTFLYKLTNDACPKSYGVNVARIAGLPEMVLRRATDRASEFESQKSMQALGAFGKKLFKMVLDSIKRMQLPDCPVEAAMGSLCQDWRLVKQHFAT